MNIHPIHILVVVRDKQRKFVLKRPGAVNDIGTLDQVARWTCLSIIDALKADLHPVLRFDPPGTTPTHPFLSLSALEQRQLWKRLYDSRNV